MFIHHDNQSGNYFLSCGYAGGDRIKGCVFVFTTWENEQQLKPVYVNATEVHIIKLRRGRYHVLVYDWVPGWKRLGPAVRKSLTVDSRPDSKLALCPLSG